MLHKCLHQNKFQHGLYKTYRELLCYFYICLDLYLSHGTTNGLKTWVDYLFPAVDGPLEDHQALVKDRQIAMAMKASGNGDIVLRKMMVNTKNEILFGASMGKPGNLYSEDLYVGPKAIFPSFDDNKTYEVMFF